ncbi:MAG: NAD(+)/NADH kinase [Candidatus Sumerlaeota bacterium]|nr:NAD(+)/NADH kinase [Candidatus Sumerlaeota bacterium]
MLALKRVGVLCRDAKAAATFEAHRDLFRQAGVRVVRLGEKRVSPVPDVVLALGGDGTLLKALEMYPHTPTLSINFGAIGFLAAGGEEETETFFRRLLAGDYLVEERILLVSRFKALRREFVNEVVVKGTTHMISVDLIVDDDLIHTIRGDGVIVGTPTGSTSYLLSTGSPIVAPQVSCILVNGINEHRFASRPLVLPDTARVRLRVNEATRESDLFVAHDGRDKIPIRVGDEISISKAAKPSRLIFFDRHAFFRNLKSRLDW